MVNKINIDPLAIPPDDGSFSEIQDAFEDCYASLFNSSFTALGRNITLHLTPTKTIDASGVEANTIAVHYNPFERRGARQVPSTISTTRSPAVFVTHRDVVYQAHIKHGPKDADDNGGVALLNGEAMTTTVIGSLPHLNECQSATIDGIRYQLEWIRPFGFRDVRYVLTKWTSINEAENPS